MPNRMGQSSYRVEFNKYNRKEQAGIHGPNFNIEVEVNKILTNVRQMNKFVHDSETTTGFTMDHINGKLRQMKQYKENRRKDLFDTSNIYHTTVPNVMVYEKGKQQLFLDKKLNKTAKVSKDSVYTQDYQNWGKIDKKLVMRRPIEKVYTLKFKGQSQFTRDQNKI